jgi:hypothetical protein
MKRLMCGCETGWKQVGSVPEKDIPSPVMEISSVVKAGDSKDASDPQLSSTFGSVGGRMDTKGRHLLVNSILSLRRVRLVSTWYPNISEVEFRSDKVEEGESGESCETLASM